MFRGKAQAFVSEVNLAKFYYKAAEMKGIATAEVWYLQIRCSRIRVVGPNELITRQAAIRKVKRRDLSLAACFALATSEARESVPLTTDSVLKEASGKASIHIPPK